MSGRDSGNAPPITRGIAGRLLAAGVVAGALLAGCDDGPAAAPTAPRAAAPAPGVSAGPPAVPAREPDVIVLQRVTTPGRSAGATGARTVRRQTWRIGAKALTARAGVVRLSVGAAKGAAGVATARDAAALAAALPPVSVLQLPALPAAAVCSGAPAWERTSQVGTLTVVARGHGDVPWSTIEVWSRGTLMTRSRSTWERRTGSWQLVAHEDVSVADGASSRVTIDRSAVRRSAADVAVPSVSCEDRKASIVAAVPRAVRLAGAGGANAWSAGLGPVGLAGLELAGATRFAAEECTPTEEEAEAACEILRLLVIGATATATGAAAAMWTACMPPAVFTGAGCVGALAAYTAASVGLAVAQAAYEDCKRDARAPAPTPACSCPTTNPPMDRASISSASGGGTSLPPAAPLALDCTEPAPSTGGGGSGGWPVGGGGQQGGWFEVCTYEDEFDEKGNYKWTLVVECHLEWIE